MTGDTGLGTLMGEIAQALPPGAMIHYPADPRAERESGLEPETPKPEAWAMAVGDGQVVEVAEDPKSGCLVFASTAGQLTDLSSAALLEILLRYNHLTESNGGFCVALGPAQEVTVMYKHPLAGLDKPWILGVVQAIAQQSAAWAELITLPPDEVSDDVAERLPPGIIFA